MVKSIKLTNIRSFSDAFFEFDEGINLIIGPNGSGKTTILEAIALTAFGRFYSLSRDFQAVSFGSEVGRVELRADIDDRRFEVEAVISAKSKIFKVNSNKLPASKMIGFIKTVYFNPETINLVSGSPKTRRGELDQTLGQVEPGFVRSLLKFKRVLKERNSLLKRISTKLADEGELDFWDEQFRILSKEIYKKRKKFIEAINGQISRIHNDLAGLRGELSLSYRPSCDYEKIEEALVASRDTDIKFNQTSLGPHRDDFEFFHKGNEHIFYRDQASRGEQRLAAAAFKVATMSFLEGSSAQHPTLIFDDIFSELDEVHRDLIDSVIQGGQVFVSATDEKMVPDIILKNSKKIILNKNG